MRNRFERKRSAVRHASAGELADGSKAQSSALAQGVLATGWWRSLWCLPKEICRAPCNTAVDRGTKGPKVENPAEVRESRSTEGPSNDGSKPIARAQRERRREGGSSLGTEAATRPESLCRYSNSIPADDTGEPQSHVVQRAKRVFADDRSELVHICTSPELRYSSKEFPSTGSRRPSGVTPERESHCEVRGAEGEEQGRERCIDDDDG